MLITHSGFPVFYSRKFNDFYAIFEGPTVAIPVVILQAVNYLTAIFATKNANKAKRVSKASYQIHRSQSNQVDVVPTTILHKPKLNDF